MLLCISSGINGLQITPVRSALVKQIQKWSNRVNFARIARLKGSKQFMLATVDYGTVMWPGNIDIAPETLYYKSKSLKEYNLFDSAETF